MLVEEISDSDLLKYAIENGIIDVESLQKRMEMKKRKEYLDMQKYEIWQGSDGYWRTYIPDNEKSRKLIKKKDRKLLEDEVVRYWKQTEENPTVKEVFEESEERRLSLNKICKATYDREKQFFNRHYKEFGKKRIKNVSEDEWQDFLEEEVSREHLNPKAFAGLKGVTRSLLKRAKKRKLIDFNITELFETLDVSDRDFQKEIKEDYQEVYDEEETDIMIKYLESHIDTKNIAILLMFITGLRIGEIVTLKHDDFEDNTVKVRRTETRFIGENGYETDVKEYPKTKAGVRTAIIPEDYMWLCKRIKATNPFSEYVFVSENKRMTTQAVRMRLRRLCIKLKIYNKSPHKVRKTYGTILMDNNIDSRMIIGQMGHTNISTSEVHYHRNRRTIEKKSAILSSIPDLKAR